MLTFVIPYDKSMIGKLKANENKLFAGRCEAVTAVSNTNILTWQSSYFLQSLHCLKTLQSIPPSLVASFSDT